jgi:hypothetical protein
VALARRGFQVVGVDCAPLALEQARRKAADAHVEADFLEADVCKLERLGDPFDLIFDRGCYHCVRRADLAGYRRSLEKNSREGTLILILAGNSDDPLPGGPPKVNADQLREELGVLGRIERLQAFHFTDVGGAQGPLGWSCLITRQVGSSAASG